MAEASATRRTLAGEVLRCRADPEYFMASYCEILSRETGGALPLRLWAHQRQLLSLLSERQLVLVLKARQIGISWFLAAYALWHSRFFDARYVAMLSYRQDEAQKLLEKVKYIWRSLPIWMRGELEPDSAFRVGFPERDSEIEVFPSTPAAGRGETATLVVADELAYHPYGRENWGALKPAIDAGHQFVGVSTANGVGNWFHQLWNEAEERNFAKVFFPWSSRPDRDEAWYSRVTEEMLSHQLAQEYPSISDEAFIVSGRPRFEREWIEVVSDISVSLRNDEKDPRVRWIGEDLTVWENPDPEELYVLGADAAEGLAWGDWSVAEAFSRLTGKQVFELRGKWEPGDFADRLAALARTYPGLLGVERNGHGHAVLLKLKELAVDGIFYSRPVLGRANQVVRPGRPGWHTTANSKALMVDDFAEALRSREILLRSQRLAEELTIYQIDDNGRTAAPSGFNDDCVMAAAIALQMRKWVSSRPAQRRKSPKPGGMAGYG